MSVWFVVGLSIKLWYARHCSDLSLLSRWFFEGAVAVDGEPTALIYLACAKWTSYLGLFGVTGAVSVHGLICFLYNRHEISIAVWTQRLAILALGCSGVFLLGELSRLLAQTYSVFGLEETFTWDSIRVVGLESRWGGRWRWQVASAIASVASVGLWHFNYRFGWHVSALMCLAAWFALPMTGHAMAIGSHWAWLIQFVHGLAAALWVGTLAAVYVLARHVVLAPDGNKNVADLFRWFSPLAIVAVPMTVISGVLSAVLYLDSIDVMWSTNYGLMLLGKVSVFVATGAVGAYNWRRLIPKLGSRSGTKLIFSSVRFELFLAVVLLFVTGILVHLAMPNEMD